MKLYKFQLALQSADKNGRLHLFLSDKLYLQKIG